MRSLRIATALLGLALMATSLAAAAESTGPDLDAIRAEQTALQADARAGTGIFEKMSEAERNELVARQDALLVLLEGKAALDELDDEGKVQAFNLLQEINAVVNKAEDEQVVCEYVRKTGSHRKVKQCSTVAERTRMRQEAADHLQRETMRRVVREPGGL